ncbi:excinuclease ABC subunit UvrA, partial [Candidatus Gracilibacteria bacterium]|nr:excinuclease ABC subunit UvrA [Candidatus Gracilibacteria bacterium]
MSQYLQVFGAKTHNLKNIDVKIPKNKMTVITGVSGSGKSSLAFNTIFAVSQQKYLESLSSYARMFIGGMSEEAQVDEILGLSPSISIDQKTTSKNPRSTVGTITEIYDYYKLLFLHIGERRCIKCGTVVKKDSIQGIIDFLSDFDEGEKYTICVPLKETFDDIADLKNRILELGFIRFQVGATTYTVNNTIPDTTKIQDVSIILDRLTRKDYCLDDSSDTKRLKDSLELAFQTGNGQLAIEIAGKKHPFSNVFVCSSCGHVPSELSISSFSFNSHAGACPSCHGLGVKKMFLEENIINPELTLQEGAVIAPGFGGDYFFSLLKKIHEETGISIDVAYKKLTKKEREIILYGTGTKKYSVQFKSERGTTNTYQSAFEGVIPMLTRRYFDGGAEKGVYDEYVVDMPCSECDGHRLQPESLSMYIEGKHIGQVSDLSVEKALEFFSKLSLSDSQKIIAEKVLKNAIDRLTFLKGVGLGYMTLSRNAGTLSGGEAQRIRLATQIGTKLEGILYILDEPSIGLHPRDNDMLIENLKKLKDLGNTLIVVEHDEDIMQNADYIIDVGPGAGIHGGNIIATGDRKTLIKDKKSITAPYLSGEKKVQVERDKRTQKDFLSIQGAKHHNLKNIDVSFPLGNFVTVTGVSGSGKSSLVNDIIAQYLANTLNRARRSVGQFDAITGVENLDKTIIIDQSPIGKTPRSNPATYTGVFTPIREVFAMSEEAKIRGYTPGRFSFNTKLGRCPECDGDGTKKIEMHFMPPIYVECEACKGKRYNPETLQVQYRGKNISEVLDMTVEEARVFFAKHPKITKILNVLNDVGLGYMKLGQSSTTLSGGEAQRIKLATELSKRSTAKTCYILDEPTTGLHFQDVQKLLGILHSLVDKGNTVLVIEHN